MEIGSGKNEETIPSPPSTFQREIVIVPVDPVDVPKDIVVGKKRPTWARQNLQKEKGHASPRGTFR